MTTTEIEIDDWVAPETTPTRGANAQSRPPLAVGMPVDDLEALVTRLRPRLVRFLRKMLVDPWAAEDVTQDVLVKLCKLHDGEMVLRRRESAEAWLYSVARNAAYDYLERTRRTRKLLVDGPDLISSDAPETPFEAAARAEAREILHAAVRVLSGRRREALELCAFEELSQEVAAQRLCCKVATVNSRVARAREGLREALRGHQDLHP